MRTRMRKILCLVLSLSLFVPCGMFMNLESSFAEEVKDTYIVIAESETTAEQVKDEYDVTNKNGKALTAELSAAEATTLENNDEILCVEEDTTIETNEELIEDMVKPEEETWGLAAVNATNASASSVVKVAIIDSGVDYSDNVVVKERKNFITESPVTTPLFEDLNGHGTSVASIIAGAGIDSEVCGVNRNIELYSARVLDENNQAPVSRVVEAIYWAIEKEVNIINISFGTSTYSEALEIAVNEAVDRGILVVAAVGNRGEEGVDYPAAFDSVLAVGSINASGSVSDFSAKGVEVDVVAPGEAVLAQGNFGEDLVFSGTSLAAPYVTGIASLLWSKDMTKSAEYIKTLIESSARDLGEAGSGNGLVDYEYALEIYDNFESAFDDLSVVDSTAANEDESTVIIEANDNEVEDFSDPIVDGSWGATVHQMHYANAAMKKGAIYPDQHDFMKGMTSHPEFHGYSWHNNPSSTSLGSGACNYVANYKFLVKIALAYGRGEGYTAVSRSDVEGLTSTCYTAIRAGIQDILDYDQESDDDNMIWGQSDATQKAFVMGIAMHTATDVFAHSAFESTSSGWARIKHPNADDTTYLNNRVRMTYDIMQNIVDRHNGDRSGINYCHDFHDAVTDAYYNTVTFKVNKLKSFSEDAGVTNSTILSDYDKIS